jgi:hypothetical protein
MFDESARELPYTSLPVMGKEGEEIVLDPKPRATDVRKRGATIGFFAGSLVGGGTGAGIGAAIIGSIITGSGTLINIGAIVGATIGVIVGAGTVRAALPDDYHERERMYGRERLYERRYARAYFDSLPPGYVQNRSLQTSPLMRLLASLVTRLLASLVTRLGRMREQ